MSSSSSHHQIFQSKRISNLHNYQGVAQRNSVAECTFPVETNTRCRMLCHLMSRLVLGRMDNCQQQRSEHHLVQKLYTGSDNDMSRRCKDPSLERQINKCQETMRYSNTHFRHYRFPHTLLPASTALQALTKVIVMNNITNEEMGYREENVKYTE